MSAKAQNTKQYDPGEEIVSFLTRYTELLDIHLDSVRQTMADTVVSLMQKVEDINQKAEEKKRLADGVLLKRRGEAAKKRSRELQGDDDEFKNMSVRVVEEKERNKVSADHSREYAKKMLTKAGNEAGSKLREHMAEFGVLGEHVGDILVSILGNLSADDIVGQRLSHVGQAIDKLNEKLDILFENMDLMNPAEIGRMRRELLERMYKSFTMEEERAVYNLFVGDKDG